MQREHRQVAEVFQTQSATYRTAILVPSITVKIGDGPDAEPAAPRLPNYSERQVVLVGNGKNNLVHEFSPGDAGKLLDSSEYVAGKRLGFIEETHDGAARDVLAFQGCGQFPSHGPGSDNELAMISKRFEGLDRSLRRKLRHQRRSDEGYKKSVGSTITPTPRAGSM